MAASPYYNNDVSQGAASADPEVLTSGVDLFSCSLQSLYRLFS